jgi:penicillin-binding protein 2
VKIIAPSVREYPYGDLYGQIIGYTGQITDEQYNGSDKNDPNAWKNLYPAAGYSDRDTVGQAGLEYQYEQYLRGEYGSQTVSLDASGKTIPGLVTNVNPPVPGGSITLNIDTREQTLARQSLKWFIDHTYKTTQGVIIVQNPQNGKILAMVSLPGYDNNLFANGITQKDFQTLITSADQPLLNKAIGAQYAPGSTFKLVTATAGLDKGFGTTRTLMTSPYIIAGGVKFPEWTTQTWGALNITEGFSHSSDTFFYQMARDVVGIKDLAAWSRNYGFGQPTGIDLPGEAAGIVPDDSWKQANFSEDMYQGDIMHDGIGQGFDATTPLQVLNAYSAMANGGNLWTPQVVKSMTDAKGVTTEVQPKLLSRLPTSAENLEVMRLAAHRVVTSRHTMNLVDLDQYNIFVAGKTGTAEYGVRDKRGRLPYHEWFVGFVSPSGDFSKTDSTLAVIAFIHGANSLGNVATEVVKYYLWLHYGVRNSAFNIRNAGSVNSWATRLSNPYGLNTRE